MPRLPADMPGTRRGAPDSRRPARAGIPTELPATIRCRSGFCGDVARAARSGASRATAPRRLSGHAAGGVPREGGGERSPWPPRRVRVCRGGSGSRCARGTGPPDNAQGRALPGRLVGWRVGDARDLTRSRGFAAAGFGGRRHCSASVVEVHVAARRLRRVVPLGIRPNGTIPLRGEGPSSGSTRPFELSSGVFIMRKAVASIRRRNMSGLKEDSASALSHGLLGRDMDRAIPWDSRQHWNARNACWRFWSELD